MKIGIFTVFLLVMLITMFKSVIDSSPILFVKVGQEQVGAVDFLITASDSTNMINGDVNVYDIDAFQDNFFVYKESYNATSG